MTSLIHIIYSSAATFDWSDEELDNLLSISRNNNEKTNVTGMLLYTDRSFFQILEGSSEAVTELYNKIAKDSRHTQVVTIIKEPIAKRDFSEWSMGYAKVSPQDLGNMIGLNDFFMQASCFGQLDQGRAKKLLAAFKEGRWRTKIKNTNTQNIPVSPIDNPMRPAMMLNNKVTFAYQPIVDINSMNVVSFEALVRGPNNESFKDILNNIEENALSHFDTLCRTAAIEMASKLGLKCNLNLNFLAHHVKDARKELNTTIEAAKRNKMEPSRIVLEIDQDKLIGDTNSFGDIIEELRSAGVKFSIDHFGAGRASLNLLEPYRPDMISLSMDLVKGIESNGPRQAIIRGLSQTCNDLGIDIVVKYIDTESGYLWFREEGFNLFQGDLFAKPGFESLPAAAYPSK